MAVEKELWLDYFSDFITQKLRLSDSRQKEGPCKDQDIAHKIMYAYFNELHGHEMPQRLVELHCHANLHHLYLTEATTLLCPLNKIENVSHYELRTLVNNQTVTAARG